MRHIAAAASCVWMAVAAVAQLCVMATALPHSRISVRMSEYNMHIYVLFVLDAHSLCCVDLLVDLFVCPCACVCFFSQVGVQASASVCAEGCACMHASPAKTPLLSKLLASCCSSDAYAAAPSCLGQQQCAISLPLVGATLLM